MKLVVASGKGGTGKTLIATNLAWMLAQRGRKVAYVDCDVEAPNGRLFLKPDDLVNERFTYPLVEMATETCSGCGECQRFCAFNAIIAVGDKVLVFSELCHACGGCLRVCPEDVLVERPRETGVISAGRVQGMTFVEGRLNVGEPRSTPLIEAVVDAAPHTRIAVVDAPPGTSCSAVAAVQGADHVLLVTEPTPFGLHDLKLAVEMCRLLGKGVSAVINRSDLGDASVRAYLEAASVPIVAEIPFDRAVSAAYAAGEMALRRSVALQQALVQVIEAVIPPREVAA